MSGASLSIKAGPAAFAKIRAEGFSRELFNVLVGASGGPKWLVLSQLDRVLAPWILSERQTPLFLIGSSIGAWRFCCYGQRDPLAAIARFEEAYIEQRYAARPSAAEVSERSRAILEILLGTAGDVEILTHPVARLNIMAVRSRGLTAAESRLALGTGLALSAAVNAVSRSGLGWFYSRSLFYDSRAQPPFWQLAGLPMERTPLTLDNLRQVVLATGAIPLVLEGVRGIAGARPGVYRDGGIIDYHFDAELTGGEGLALYPHFYGEVIPGWFDKALRRRAGTNLDRVLLIHPTEEFVSRLPFARIPDRKDFAALGTAERIDYWRQTVAACERLAEELSELIERDRLPAALEPFA